MSTFAQFPFSSHYTILQSRVVIDLFHNSVEIFRPVNRGKNRSLVRVFKRPEFLLR